ncbi:hypothetical protein ABES23_14515 [Peribacillus frigoritolerans]|uniref:hypothetical protein n=1 Tax=Peribacillus frigoritolerans TaxID=450367 RepID=UPI003D292183
MEIAKVIDFANEKKDAVVNFGIKATSVTIGSASGGAVVGASGASIGAGIGFILGGPPGAGIGFAVGSFLGTGSGMAAGAVGGNKVGKIITKSLKED